MDGTNKQKILDQMSDFWEVYHFPFCLFLGILTGFAFYMEWIKNFQDILGAVVSFASMILAIIGIFFTLFITIQNADIFKRLRSVFPKTSIKLIKYMRNLFFYGIVLVVLSILFHILPSAGKLDSIGVGVWGFFFWDLSIGSCFIIKLLSDLLIKQNRKDSIPRMKISE